MFFALAKIFPVKTVGKLTVERDCPQTSFCGSHRECKALVASLGRLEGKHIA